MFRLIGGAVGVAWALAGWANLPRLDHPQADGGRARYRWNLPAVVLPGGSTDSGLG